MQFSITTLIFALAALTSAAVVERQNAGRPTPSGTCCVANTNLKQDACTSTSGAGRCVPGGNSCGGALSCIAQADLACDASITERGKSLCRAKAPGGGFIDGAKIITSLSQATLN